MRHHEETTHGPLQRLFAAFTRRKNLQRAVKDLQALDDFLLNDIGIRRAEIELIVGKDRDPRWL